MAQVVYGIQLNGPSKRKLNPAAPPQKKVVNKDTSKLKKIAGANTSFIKKKDFTVLVQAPVVVPEKPLETEVVVENLVSEVEKPLETEAPVENQLPKAEGWKAKREKKKVPYGLKENPETPSEQ
jgi:hypothetical protein